MSLYNPYVTIVEAARKSRWIRRRSWPSWICLLDAAASGQRSLTHADVTAEDWCAYEGLDDETESDDSAKRFSLIELD